LSTAQCPAVEGGCGNSKRAFLSRFHRRKNKKEYLFWKTNRRGCWKQRIGAKKRTGPNRKTKRRSCWKHVPVEKTNRKRTGKQSCRLANTMPAKKHIEQRNGGCCTRYSPASDFPGLPHSGFEYEIDGPEA